MSLTLFVLFSPFIVSWFSSGECSVVYEVCYRNNTNSWNATVACEKDVLIYHSGCIGNGGMVVAKIGSIYNDHFYAQTNQDNVTKELYTYFRLPDSVSEGDEVGFYTLCGPSFNFRTDGSGFCRHHTITITKEHLDCGNRLEQMRLCRLKNVRGSMNCILNPQTEMASIDVSYDSNCYITAVERTSKRVIIARVGESGHREMKYDTSLSFDLVLWDNNQAEKVECSLSGSFSPSLFDNFV